MGKAWLALVMLVGAVAWPADAARVTMDVEVGFDGMFRPGLWNPVHITVSDAELAAARGAVLELSVPRDMNQSLRLRQSVMVGPEPRTYLVYTPLWYALDEVMLTLRDAESRRVLGQRPAVSEDADAARRGFRSNARVDDGTLFVAVAGREAHTRMMAPHIERLGYAGAAVGLNRLPGDAIGYDALDVLVLADVPLGELSAGRQQAIVDWVFAGGALVVMVAAESAPTEGPLGALLPCTVHEPVLLPMPHELADLPQRLHQADGRRLAGRPGARAVEPFAGVGWSVYVRRAGLGRVMVAPLLPPRAELSEGQARAFYLPLLREVSAVDAAQEHRGWSGGDSALGHARRAAIERVGHIPGVGQFSFEYIALVLLGLSVAVGPVDWLVLKLLRRQPWTWLTVAGWIACVTTGALYIGHIVNSGELRVRTLRVVDEADGRCVADSELLAMYAPRTQRYALTGDVGWWWTTPSMSEYMGRGGGFNQVELVQDLSGTRPPPEGMRVNVWSLRLLEAHRVAPARAAVLGGEMRIGGLNELTGTLSNRGDRPVRLLGVLYADQWRPMDVELAAGATVDVKPPAQTLSFEHMLTARQFGRRREQVSPRIAMDLARATVLAEVLGAPGDVTVGENAESVHEHYIRTLLPVKEGR